MRLKEYIGKVISITTIDGFVYTGKVVELDGPAVSESHEVEIGIDFAGGIMMIQQSQINEITM